MGGHGVRTDSMRIHTMIKDFLFWVLLRAKELFSLLVRKGGQYFSPDVCNFWYITPKDGLYPTYKPLNHASKTK